jgi:hypothetical protein
MARSICDLGYSRLWMVEDLQCILFAKMISTGQPVVVPWLVQQTLFPTIFARFLYNARIWTVMAISRRGLGYSRLWQDQNL